MNRIRKFLAPLTVFVVAAFGVPSHEAAASQVDALIEKLVEKRILTRIDAESLRSEVETAESKSFKEELKKSNGWLDKLSSKGDVRMRYEAFNREDEDASDRNRFRFRVRWGLEKKFDDEWTAGFRLASGSGTNEAVSTNQTFDGEFGLKSVFIDQAYAKWQPTQHMQQWFSATDKAEIGFGKVANPYEKWGTSIIWDGDVTPEGIYELWDLNLWKGEDSASWKLHTLTGQWVLDEDSNLSPGDQEMQSYGIGTTYQWAKGHNTSFKFTYYDWQEYSHFLKVNPSSLANSFGGADREVEDFKVVNFYGDLNFEAPAPFFGTQPFKIYGDYAHNTDVGSPLGATGDETLRNPALREDEDDAYSIGVTMGKAKDPGSWQAGYEYYHLEANATPGVFTESDLGLGHNNNRGHKLSWKYMLQKNLELNLTAWIVERINKTIITYGAGDFTVNGDDNELLRTQVDLVYKF